MLKQLLLLAFIFLYSVPAFAQGRLANSQLRSPYTYIYKITDEQALRIYEKGPDVVKNSFFHTVIDSFAINKSYTKPLPHGHYLYMHAQGPDLVYWLETKSQLQAKLLHLQPELALLVHDSLGQLVRDATIMAGDKRVPFDSKTNTYRLKKGPKKGIVSVSHQGHTFYEELASQYEFYKPKWWQRLINTWPMRYTWQPFRDMYRTIQWGQPEGWIHSVAAIFDEDYRREKPEKYKGYLVTNKPLYQPGDTVRYKAYVVNRNGKPVPYKAQLVLYGYDSKRKKLGELDPYRKGAYEGWFVLHDSLNLRLDASYNLLLERTNKREDVLVRHSFTYEDYELKENKYTLRLAHEEHQAGVENQVHVRGTDANGLNLLDARVEVVVLTRQVFGSREQQVFVPDTLWKHSQPLEATGETSISIPATSFPTASLRYQVRADFLNSSNERSFQSCQASYTYTPGQLKLSLSQDSLLAQYLEGDKPVPQKAQLIAVDANGNKVLEQQVQLPSRLPVNPYMRRYILQTPEQEASLALNTENAQLQAYTDRSKDSLYFVLDNPRKLPYWFFVYRGDKLVEQGKGQERDFRYTRALRGDAPYFVTMRYMWGGEIRSDEKVAPHRRYTLNLEVEAPQVVYPGQQSNLTVTVLDAKGKPVPNADLTAYAITSKFTAQGVPTLPSWDRYKGRKPYQKLKLNNDTKASSQLMDWQVWSRRMGLDSMAYYNFLYPKQGIFTEYSLSRDSLTQFSPFVVDSGRVVPVHVVYLDRVPVYFSGTDVMPAYSFAADSGYHTIMMRTTDKLIKLDSVYLRPYHKLVLSADITKSDVPYAAKAEKENVLSTRERNNLHGYLLQVEQNFDSDLAYLKQGRRVLGIQDNPARNNHYYSATKSLLAGPFSPGYLQFTRYNRFNTTFDMEPGYTYTFERELLRMRERQLLPEHVHLGNWNKQERNPVPLYDKASTEQHLQQEWEELNREFWLQKALGNNPRYDDYLPKGRVGWRLDNAFTQRPAIAVLHKAGQPDSARLYSGNTLLVSGIPIGKYQLTLLFPDSSYVTTDLQVQANGQVQLYLQPAAQKKADSSSQTLQQLINRRIREAQRGVSIEVQQQVIRQMRNDNYTSGLNEYSTTVSGIVVDAGSGEPLPGVAVLVKGTHIGTATDANGYYQLGVPSNAVLVFRYIGYAGTELPVDGRRILDASLQVNIQELQEVVVVGYGAQEKKSMTYAAATVVEGSATGIRIRGNASIQSASSPLIIVNGMPYGGKLSDLDPALIASMTKLDAAAGMAIYGSVAAGGVIIIGGKTGPEGLTAELPVDEAGAIRENFSDFAFWQPRLLTDRKGQATFPVTFPGDITSWNTYVLGMDGRKRTGIYSTSIKSFKAMIATLAMPRFLVEGDKTQVIGKALNYLPDSSNIITRFEVAGKQERESQILLKRAYTDTLTFTAPSVAPDSVEVLFALRSAEGMADGERRHIRVYPKGTEETSGHFLALHADTTLTLDFDPAKGPVKLHAKGNLLEVMLEEIDYLHRYEYWCSEQAASKLKALLLEKRIREQLGEKFTHERMVRRLVRHLEKTQLPEGAWTWWQSGPAYTWITSHVVEALSLAKAEGYAPKYDEQKLHNFMVYRLEQARFTDKLLMLETLHKLQAKVDYTRYVQELSKREGLSSEEQLRLTRMRQLLKLEAPLDTLQKYKKVTTLGGLHWGENRYSLFNNHISNTLLAYDILKAAGGHEQELASIRAYLLSERRSGHWRNTYESARILETLLPDLLNKKESDQPLQNTLQLTGPLRLEVSKFPVDTTFLPGQPLVIRKTGKLPLYLTAYQTHWNASPEPVQKDFVVKTSFKGIVNQVVLTAGKPIELVVEVEAKADADYVLIEVPIPAGCSYDEKTGRGSYEVHREYFRHKVAIFADRLPKGRHTYTIKLLPRYSGVYTVNPARVELMYFPVFYGRTGLKEVRIK
ncbi:carboxypeptidase-like regulatory domain-containing protein [Pontibacter sp. HSC-14F20]|uniref:carboxypeptidase-like regulatory domain-containing protein n=1 Tax=Pontibacter sp. HSC-14F20 TaxID=2864136 RepID=UPI001C72CA1A|nr:carboxypeptidase-like regulatory domain-containing protein [Pontibacter sp. HSC-14F20]MBX0332898.1 carboxypeptidase-like regulatory domain-containing protein [Pontibacter sp. HSC-14F20]